MVLDNTIVLGYWYKIQHGPCSDRASKRMICSVDMAAPVNQTAAQDQGSLSLYMGFVVPNAGNILLAIGLSTGRRDLRLV